MSQEGEHSDPQSPKGKGSTGSGCAPSSRIQSSALCLSFPTHPLQGNSQPRGAVPGFTSAPWSALEHTTAASSWLTAQQLRRHTGVKPPYTSKELQTSKHTCFSTEQQKELDFVTGLCSVSLSSGISQFCDFCAQSGLKNPISVGCNRAGFWSSRGLLSSKEVLMALWKTKQNKTIKTSKTKPKNP